MHYIGLQKLIGKSDLSSPCMQPKAEGLCRAVIPSFYFDVQTGICTLFDYSGCHGNQNRFATEEECKQECYGFPNFGQSSEVPLVTADSATSYLPGIMRYFKWIAPICIIELYSWLYNPYLLTIKQMLKLTLIAHCVSSTQARNDAKSTLKGAGHTTPKQKAVKYSSTFLAPAMILRICSLTNMPVWQDAINRVRSFSFNSIRFDQIVLFEM